MPGLVALPPDDLEEVIDPSGTPQGWTYRTRHLRLGEFQVQRQWSMRGFVSGTLMCPREGALEISSPGYRLTYRSPVVPGSVEGHGVVAVIRPVQFVVVKPKRQASD